jgi:short subunit dehydrogenase-like uncharacterized protein
MPRHDDRSWMVYGAYGVTGRLIAEEAVRRGYRPVLAGRNPERLGAVARELGLPSVAVSLDDSQSLCEALRQATLVIHAAGPYVRTARPMIKACIDTRTPYVDVSGEQACLRIVEDFGPRAEAAGIPLLTAAGFGATYGDCLARHVVDRLPDATHLRLSVAADSAYRTPAVQSTILSVLADGGGAIENGQWVSRPLAHETWVVRNGAEAIPFAAAPMPELMAAFLSTDVPNIVVGRPMPHMAARLARMLTPLLRGALKLPALRNALEPRGEAKPQAASGDGDHRSRIWAEAFNARGQRASAFLETGEGYAAAAAAVTNAEALLGRTLAGAFTPGRAFGAAHLLKLPDVRLTDIDSAMADSIPVPAGVQKQSHGQDQAAFR